MERYKNNFIFDISVLVLLILGIGILMFSNNLLLSITVGLILILYSVISNINVKNKKNNTLKYIQENNQTSIVYKENNRSTILLSLMLTITSLVNLDTIYRNSDSFNNNPYKLHNILDFIISMNVQEATKSVTFILLLLVCILNFIKFKNSTAVVSDDIILFHDGTIIEFSKIVSLEYKHQYFGTKKYKMLKICTKEYIKEVIVDLQDSDKLKDYIDSKIAIG